MTGQVTAWDMAVDVANIFAATCVPFVLFMLETARRQRATIIGKLEHQDSCMDNLRLEFTKMTGVIVTRAEMSQAVGRESDERQALARSIQASLDAKATREELTQVANRLAADLREMRLGRVRDEG